MSLERQLGPIKGATLVTKDARKLANAYVKSLKFSIHRETFVSQKLSSFWHSPNLVGSKVIELASADGNVWLRVVEDKHANAPKPLKSLGWMSLETNVADVDALNKTLDRSDFEVIGEPAYLQVSDAIKAMQVIGPAGEVSYLTQVDRPCPPFELPQTELFTAGLFIPVLATQNRKETVSFYESLNKADAALLFDTKVTVLNKVWKKENDHQYPVATLQIHGSCLFEIDEVKEAARKVRNPNGLVSGIAIVSVFARNLDDICTAFNVEPYQLDEN